MLSTCSITRMNIWKDNHNEASNTNKNTSYFLESVLCAQEKPSKKHDRWDWPTIQEHDTCYGCVLIGLHHCKYRERIRQISRVQYKDEMSAVETHLDLVAELVRAPFSNRFHVWFSVHLFGTCLTFFFWLIHDLFQKVTNNQQMKSHRDMISKMRS